MMSTWYSLESGIERISTPVIPETVLEADVEDLRPTRTRLRIKIPKSYHHEPIISRLISEHGLTVNIIGALLGASARDDGWFDLELQGSAKQLSSALTYLDELNLEIWHDTDDRNDGW
jgi:ABC-type methionine transport system ATPase subunit